MFEILDISYSGLIAQKTRISVISNNVSNVDTTGPNGPYRRKLVVFHSLYEESLNSAKMKGVKVAKIIEDPSPFKRVYNPSHPDADSEGYVLYPNVSISQEMVDLISATRAYEANIACFNTVKQIFLRTLDIGV